MIKQVLITTKKNINVVFIYLDTIVIADDKVPYWLCNIIQNTLHISVHYLFHSETVFQVIKVPEMFEYKHVTNTKRYYNRPMARSYMLKKMERSRYGEIHKTDFNLIYIFYKTHTHKKEYSGKFCIFYIY